MIHGYDAQYRDDSMKYLGEAMDFPDAQIDCNQSAQYWCSWILAYYQWYTVRSFPEIHKYITMQEIEMLY